MRPKLKQNKLSAIWDIMSLNRQFCTSQLLYVLKNRTFWDSSKDFSNYLVIKFVGKILRAFEIEVLNGNPVDEMLLNE